MKSGWQCDINSKEIRVQDLVQYHLYLWCLWNLGKKLTFFFQRKEKTQYDGKHMEVGARNIQIQNSHLLLTGLLVLTGY